MGRIFEKRKESIFKTASQKSKLYARHGKQLYMAAKNGVPDPEANPILRSMVEKAKREQVPSHVIEKAIQKASGAGGEDFQPVRYEGFGPARKLGDYRVFDRQQYAHRFRDSELFQQDWRQNGCQWLGHVVFRSPGRFRV